MCAPCSMGCYVATTVCGACVDLPYSRIGDRRSDLESGSLMHGSGSFDKMSIEAKADLIARLAGKLGSKSPACDEVLEVFLGTKGAELAVLKRMLDGDIGA